MRAQAGAGAVSSIAEAVTALVGSLDADRRARLSFALANDERRTWHYRPVPRRGLPLSDLDAAGQKLAHHVAALALSPAAYAQVTAIIGLENVLDEKEGGHRRRDPSQYFTTVFGDVAGNEWGWRFEGHHVSLNLTVADEGAAVTPLFLGANPATVAAGGHAFLRALGPEEDLGRRLLHSLATDARRRAVVDDAAPDDILTTNQAHARDPLEPLGVAGADLGGEARDLLLALVRIYAGRAADGLGGHETARLEQSLDDIHFAWAGGAEAGQGHYYRLQGPRFLVEYDNTQDGANHIHTVWRDPVGDFGDDLLRRHRSEAHGGA